MMQRQPYCTKTPTTHKLIGGEESDEANQYIQWDQKVFSQPLIEQVLLLRMMSNFHHRYTSTKRDKMRNPGNHIVGFLKGW